MTLLSVLGHLDARRGVAAAWLFGSHLAAHVVSTEGDGLPGDVAESFRVELTPVKLDGWRNGAPRTLGRPTPLSMAVSSGSPTSSTSDGDGTAD